MTWNELKSKLKKLRDPKIAGQFRNYIYQTDNNLSVSDTALRNWHSGRSYPSAEYAILLKGFFEEMEKNEIV
jgi:hypothetical protein